MMNVDLIFRIAAVGVLGAGFNQLLIRAGRGGEGLMTAIGGLGGGVVILVQEIGELFTMMKAVFGF